MGFVGGIIFTRRSIFVVVIVVVVIVVVVALPDYFVSCLCRGWFYGLR